MLKSIQTRPSDSFALPIDIFIRLVFEFPKAAISERLEIKGPLMKWQSTTQALSGAHRLVANRSRGT